MIELYVVPADIPGLLPPACAPLRYIPGPRYQTSSLQRPGEPCTLLALETRGSAAWAEVAFGACVIEPHPLAALGLDVADPIGRTIAQAWLWLQVVDGRHAVLHPVVSRAELVDLGAYRAHDVEWWTPQRIGRLCEVVMRVAGRWAP